MTANEKKYRRIVVLTGAGISAESGLRTFRDGDGLWENHAIEEVATPEGFQNDPDLVQRFYNERRRQLADVQPNAAHRALAEFEQQFDGHVLVITQNVDDLHERAGSKNLIHMHGELKKVRCLISGDTFTWNEDITDQSRCPCCQARSLRPHIVWFGEMPLEMERIYGQLAACDLFIAIGTSGHVYPAAGFVDIVKQVNAHTVEINLEPSQVEDQFAEHIYGKASDTVAQFLRSLL